MSDQPVSMAVVRRAPEEARVAGPPGPEHTLGREAGAGRRGRARLLGVAE